MNVTQIVKDPKVWITVIGLPIVVLFAPKITWGISAALIMAAWIVGLSMRRVPNGGPPPQR